MTGSNSVFRRARLLRLTMGLGVAMLAGPAFAAVPIASNDFAFTATNTSVSVSVLANDYEPDGDTIVFYEDGILDGPYHGQARTSGQQIVYTPDSDFQGTDSLTYAVHDGQGIIHTDWASLTIMVIERYVDANQSPPSSLNPRPRPHGRRGGHPCRRSPAI